MLIENHENQGLKGLMFLFVLGFGFFGQSNHQAWGLEEGSPQRINLGEVMFLMTDVQMAEGAVSLARLAVEGLTTNLNPSLTLNPSAKYADDQVTLNASFTGSINLGRSADVQSRLVNAEQALSQAELQLSQALNDSLLKISRSYFAAVLAVQEQTISEQEFQLAQARLRLDQDKFERGEVSFLDLSRSEQDFQIKLSALQDLIRKAELALEDLSLLIPDGSLEQSVTAGQLPITLHPLAPHQIQDLVEQTHPEILKQSAQVQGALDRLTTTTSALSLSLRTGLDLDGHSFGVSYNFSNTSLGLSYGMPSITLGNQPQSTGGGTSSTTTSTLWSVTASASLGIQPNLTGSIEQETNLLNLEREEQRLETLKQSINLGINRSWVDLERANLGVIQQEEGLERARFLYSVVETRRNLGIVGDLDLEEAKLAVVRAEFNLFRARVLVEQQQYIYAHLTGMLGSSIFLGEVQ